MESVKVSPLINIHAVIPASRINGPGKRLVVFFQGCRKLCPGCFNPETHSLSLRTLLSPADIFDRYLAPSTEGITVSGGEPFLQPEGLYGLLSLARGKGLTTVVYTGLEYEDILRKDRATLGFTDVLVDGGYEEGKKEPTLLARGSTNQRFFFLTDRYAFEDFYMPAKAEVTITDDGRVVKTGFSRITGLIEACG
jgi:anaerobic ribonucleoside-triphosphate reductase activating protein